MLLLFRNPRFRLLWISGFVNDLGTMMYFMVHGWLTLTVTDSPFWVGAAAGTFGLGMMSFSVFGGVLADRLDRPKLIVGALLIQVATSLILAALVFSGRVELWQILLLAFLEGCVVSVKIPARMALTLDLVGRERLLSAVAANFGAMTAMGIVAPLVGGAVVSALHIGWAYLIMASAYLASAAILINLRGVSRADGRRGSPWHDLKEGVRYVFAAPVLRSLILMALVVETFGWAHESMLPVMARDVLGVGPSGLGYLLSAASAGGAVATVVVGNLGEVVNKGRLVVVGFGGFGLFLVLFAASPWFPLSMALLALAHGAVIAYEAALNTMLQTAVPDAMRGRVLSFQAFTWGLTGFSGFHTGAIASLVGAPLAIGIGGGVLVLNALRLARPLSRLQERPAEGVVGD